jgi:hypothetical protein
MAAFPKRGGSGRGSGASQYSPQVLSKIKHDHQKVLQQNALREKKAANKNLQEIGVYFSMAEEHDGIPIAGLKFVTALRSQRIEAQRPDWKKYDHKKFGLVPLSRYPRSDEIDLIRYRDLQKLDSDITDHIMSHIKEKKKIELGKETEWMYDFCRITDPVLSFITSPEEFTIEGYDSLIFTAFPFEIPHEDRAKLYIVLVKSEKIAGWLVIDYFFYYF